MRHGCDEHIVSPQLVKVDAAFNLQREELAAYGDKRLFQRFVEIQGRRNLASHLAKDPHPSDYNTHTGIGLNV